MANYPTAAPGLASITDASDWDQHAEHHDQERAETNAIGTDLVNARGASATLAAKIAAMDASIAAKAAASHGHAGEDITSGTIAEARIASTIARDTEVTAAIAAHEAAANPHTIYLTEAEADALYEPLGGGGSFLADAGDTATGTHLWVPTQGTLFTSGYLSEYEAVSGRLSSDSAAHRRFRLLPSGKLWLTDPATLPTSTFDAVVSCTVASCTTTNGSNVVQIASTADPTAAKIGGTISGTNIPGGTTISALGPAANELTLSANATGSGTVTLTFQVYRYIPSLYIDQWDKRQFYGMLIRATTWQGGISQPLSIMDNAGSPIFWVNGAGAAAAGTDNFMLLGNSLERRLAWLFRDTGQGINRGKIFGEVFGTEANCGWDNGTNWTTWAGTSVTYDPDASTGLWLARVGGAPAGQTVRFTGTTTSGSPTITSTGINGTLYDASTTSGTAGSTDVGDIIGATITGTGIPASTTITAVTSTTMTLSQNATASGTVADLTITMPVVAGVLGISGRLAVPCESTAGVATIRGLQALTTTGLRWDNDALTNGYLVCVANGADQWRTSTSGLFPIGYGTKALGFTNVPWDTVYSENFWTPVAGNISHVLAAKTTSTTIDNTSLTSFQSLLGTALQCAANVMKAGEKIVLEADFVINTPNASPPTITIRAQVGASNYGTPAMSQTARAYDKMFKVRVTVTMRSTSSQSVAVELIGTDANAGGDALAAWDTTHSRYGTGVASEAFTSAVDFDVELAFGNTTSAATATCTGATLTRVPKLA